MLVSFLLGLACHFEQGRCYFEKTCRFSENIDRTLRVIYE